jgi:short-subunit dehydrogenase
VDRRCLLGIGAALAVELDARGARLALSARSAKGLQQVAGGLRDAWCCRLT